MRRVQNLCLLALLLLAACLALAAPSQKSASHSGKRTAKAAATKAGDYRPDIVTAVKAAAKKDCGCGMCAGKGCAPCKGKNCYYCVSKALVAQDCGCKGCSAKGCSSCGPGCDVCKFHLAPVAEAKAGGQHTTKQPTRGR